MIPMSRLNRTKPLLHLLRQIWAAAAMLAIAAAAPAATLHVTVSGADGRPAADVVVMVLAAGAGPAAAAGAAPLAIEQRDFRFVPYVTVVPIGGSVRFVNKDTFDHHIRSMPSGPLGGVAPVKNFEYRLAAAGKGSDASEVVKLDIAGSITLGCHLHGSMRGHLLVTTTPWFAVTDDRGRAQIEGLPEGAVEMKLWHPDQLTDQALQPLQLGPSLGTEARLNFTPRRRPAPRRPDAEYGPPGSK